jgi:hypothetical protein
MNVLESCRMVLGCDEELVVEANEWMSVVRVEIGRTGDFAF